jgi:hypothetical protein
MALKNYLFTSESVTEGHPDKICDQVSDAVLDAHLATDPHARVACETAVKTGFVIMRGRDHEPRTRVNYPSMVRERGEATSATPHGHRLRRHHLRRSWWPWSSSRPTSPWASTPEGLTRSRAPATRA